MRAVMIKAFGASPELTQTPTPSARPTGWWSRSKPPVCAAVTGTAGWGTTDIALPHVPGHELAGTIAEMGPQVTRWQMGDRVTPPFSSRAVGAGLRSRRRPGWRGDGTTGVHPWGSFADLVALPRADLNLVRVPDEARREVAASLAVAPTAYRGVAHVARVDRASRWVVQGAGVLGCLR